MTIREQTEKDQDRILSKSACRAMGAGARPRAEEPCPIRTCFARDRDRILHSNAFRRLKHKTQVYISPRGDHYRQRMTHTLEVVQIARTIARALRLNEDLTEAIALGHDLGHTPFGHTGEGVLDALSRQGFSHHAQSLRVVDVLEREGKGLNLTEQVRDGIINHRTSGEPKTLEGQVVRLSDKIAYVNHDIQDALQSGDLTPKMLPKALFARLGQTNSQRINALIVDVISHSDETGIRLSPTMHQTLFEVRRFLFEKVYQNPRVSEQNHRAEKMVTLLFHHFMEEEQSMPSFFELIAEQEGRERAVMDYIAGMTDNFATQQFMDLYLPGMVQPMMI